MAVSALPALLLTFMFAQPNQYFVSFLSVWADFLVGPLRYWLPVLLGFSSEYSLHPMAGNSTWVYVVCLPLTFVHPLKPHLLTACVTVGAFGVWYYWAFLTFVAYNCPC